MNRSNFRFNGKFRLEVIRPYPKAGPKTMGCRRRKKRCAAILTATPKKLDRLSRLSLL